MSAFSLVDAVSQADAERVLIARALDPVLRNELAKSVDCDELPFVRGRTVVPDDLTPGDLVVAGHPNYLGVFDMPAAPQWIAVTGAWSSLRPAKGASARVAMSAPLDRAEASLLVALDVAKQLDQLRGVTIAFAPESPVIIALVTVDPEEVVTRMAIPGCSTLSGYGELPGGLRIEMGAEPAGYAPLLEQAISEIEESTEDLWRQAPAP